ncbi:hypothetical protein SUGI_1067030 [Cryptomeria japonica]|nr:hypothetical protein SUGI_1067030 [Cryptomeria japonica]
MAPLKRYLGVNLYGEGGEETTMVNHYKSRFAETVERYEKYMHQLERLKLGLSFSQYEELTRKSSQRKWQIKSEEDPVIISQVISCYEIYNDLIKKIEDMQEKMSFPLFANLIGTTKDYGVPLQETMPQCTSHEEEEQSKAAKVEPKRVKNTETRG